MNQATRWVATAWGIIFGVSSISHGFFEAMQGNTPTNGLFITAISESHQMWEHGSEPAFTLIPNFLLTGIAAIIVGILLITWCVRFLHTKHGATVMLFLFVLSVLVGGGIAQVLLFPIVWAGATRINAPLIWWSRILPKGSYDRLARIWPWTLALSSALLLFTLVVATFGYIPGTSDPDQVLNAMFLSLITGLGLYILSFVAGFAHDIQQQDSPQVSQSTTA